jgi:hypothetical protein
MFLAIDKLLEKGKTEYSIGQLFNELLVISKDVFRARQSVNMSLPVGRVPSMFPWPLIPQKPYESPLMRATRTMGEADPSLACLLEAPSYGQQYMYGVPGLSGVDTNAVNSFFYSAPTS